MPSNRWPPATFAPDDPPSAPELGGVDGPCEAYLSEATENKVSVPL
jgi:hypothetical protein